MSTAIAKLEMTTNANVQGLFQAFRTEMKGSMIERDEEMQVVLSALLCDEHVCLVGPPGTGKSMSLDAIVGWLAAPSFKALLHKYIVPEELIGPVSIVKLKQDVYERLLGGRAADTEVLFLDEIFKGSPAILNTLLMLLNERKIYNGGTVVDCPLKLCVAASNEWPGEGSTGAELSALFDRFLFRKNVSPIRSESGIDALCFGNLPEPVPSFQLSDADLKSAQADVRALAWSEEAKDAFNLIRREIRAEGVIVGDRRLKKSVAACQANAYLNGNIAVTIEDLEILRHILWVDPTEQPAVVQKIVCKIAAPAMQEINAFLAEAEEINSKFNAQDLGQAALAFKKLDEIGRKLKGLKGDRATEAHTHVTDLAKKMKAAAIGHL